MLPDRWLYCCACRCELAYIESTQGLVRGQRVWQLAFGSGFKFNSAVLQANRRIQDHHPAWDNFDAQVRREEQSRPRAGDRLRLCFWWRQRAWAAAREGE